MKPEERIGLAFGIFLWLLMMGIYLFPANELAFSFYGRIGSLFALPFGMWAVWRFHQTWKPWGLSGQKSDNQQENRGMWLMIAVIGSVLLQNLISTFASPEVKSFIMAFIGISFLIPYTYALIQVIRYRPRK